MPNRPFAQIGGFLIGNVPPAGNFLLVQKVTKDTVKGGAFYKDAPPLTIPPSETKNIAWPSSWAIS